ncbi:ATP-dependent endonuclease [Streptomyces ferrugineus]|uniref:ATP-dependent endonuclease n=1 Tax=Streptomyces ferrugineus TaxID=1413221 RepID=A0A7M2SYV8_9ACTN|nr:TOPRIM nucleotidyl transferase/hydrolase domain-containing protein [Streptomyces ferrugineus]QOV40753.1 ATP-dependent endonuclease [Streptomyces ferrugineus]
MADMGAFKEAVTAWAAGGPGRPARELAAELSVRTVVLLEGPSDAAAVGTLAERRGRDLAAEGACLVAMGGAMSIARYARLLGPAGLGLRLTGLCDVAERPYYSRALHSTGIAQPDIFVCTADLEDELIRALGTDRVEELVHAQDDQRALHTFLRQPAQQDRAPRQQLRRFLGTKKGRKIHYARVLTEALGPDQVPTPLNDLLASL